MRRREERQERVGASNHKDHKDHKEDNGSREDAESLLNAEFTVQIAELWARHLGKAAPDFRMDSTHGFTARGYREELAR